jgi:apolipoprotein N-acyltransferase
MRAAENRRWLLRATNDGITATVNPAGRVVFRADPYRLLSADVPYEYRRDVTVYTRFGDWFAWSCLIVGLLVVLFTSIRSLTVEPFTRAGSPERRRL